MILVLIWCYWFWWHIGHPQIFDEKNNIGKSKYLDLLKNVFFVGSTSFANANSLNSIPMSCISRNNQECKTTPQIVNVTGDEPVFLPFSIEKSKCSGGCNNINYPYAKMCVPDVVKKLNVKVFNLMSRTKKIRFIECHGTC